MATGGYLSHQRLIQMAVARQSQTVSKYGSHPDTKGPSLVAWADAAFGGQTGEGGRQLLVLIAARLSPSPGLPRPIH